MVDRDSRNPYGRRWPAGSPPGPPSPRGHQGIVPQFWAVPGANAVDDAHAVQVGPGVSEFSAERSHVETMGGRIAAALCSVQLNMRSPTYVTPSALAESFYECSSSDVAVSDGTWVDIVLLYPVQGQNVVVRKLGMQLPTAAAFGDVQWRVVAGSSPFDGWSNVRCQVGSLTRPADVMLKNGGAEGPRRVALQAMKLTAGSVNARGVLAGWIDTPRAPGGGPESWLGD